MNKTELLTHLLLYGADICLMLTLTLLMFFNYKKCPDRSRIFLGSFYFIFTLAEVANSIRTIVTPNMGDNFVPLMPVYTAISYLLLILSMLYPVEILRPNWFKLKHFIITLIPWFIILVLLYGWQEGNIRVLHNSSEVFKYIHEPNVWLRLLMSLLFIPFALFVIYMPMNWRKSSMNKRQIHILFSLLFISISFFTINNIWRNFIVVNIFRFIVWAQIIYAVYYELFCRLNVTTDISNNTAEDKVNEYIVSGLKYNEESVTDDKDNLLRRLEEIMKCQDIWTNPNFQQEDLCRITGTNRTYLLTAIKKMNYKTFHEMLNSYRINYVLSELNKNPNASIHELCYQAGYRSVITAKRNFAIVAGCTYYEYIERYK